MNTIHPSPWPRDGSGRVPRIALTACLASWLVGCASLPPQVARAQRLFDERSYDAAHAAAVEAEASAPAHPVARRVAIHSSYNLGRADRAVTEYRAWYQHRGSHDETLLGRLALTTLWQGLRVPSTAVRVLAIQAVERRQVEKLARDVESAIEDESDAVAAAAAVAVLRSRYGAADVATQLLASDIPLARAIAIEGIGRKIGRPARGDLAASLGDPEPSVRAASARALGAMDVAEDAPRLARLAADDTDPQVRAAALQGLALGSSVDAVQAGQRALADPAPPVQLAGLALLRERRARDALERVTTDDPIAARAPWLRLHAQLALAAIEGAQPPQASPWDQTWRQTTAHDSWTASAPVRAATAQLLGPAPGQGRGQPPAGLPPDTALAWLGALTQDQDATVRVSAAASLWRLGQDDALAQLSDQCQAQDFDAQVAAIRAHRDARRLSLGLVAALADDSALVRVHAAEAILAAVSGR